MNIITEYDSNNLFYAENQGTAFCINKNIIGKFPFYTFLTAAHCIDKTYDRYYLQPIIIKNNYHKSPIICINTKQKNTIIYTEIQSIKNIHLKMLQFYLLNV